jgi:hypothetical protein
MGATRLITCLILLAFGASWHGANVPMFWHA